MHTLCVDVTNLQTAPRAMIPSYPSSCLELAALEKKLSAQIDTLKNEIDSKALQTGVYVFTSLDHCVTFATKRVPEDELQRFMNIIIYLQFVGNEVVERLESQASKLHAAKVERFEEQSVVIGAFKTDIPPFFGCPPEVKERKIDILRMSTHKQ